MLTTGMFDFREDIRGSAQCDYWVRIRIAVPITTNVYGLRNARATIHIDDSLKFLYEAGPGTRKSADSACEVFGCETVRIGFFLLL